MDKKQFSVGPRQLSENGRSESLKIYNRALNELRYRYFCLVMAALAGNMGCEDTTKKDYAEDARVEIDFRPPARDTGAVDQEDSREFDGADVVEVLEEVSVSDVTPNEDVALPTANSDYPAEPVYIDPSVFEWYRYTQDVSDFVDRIEVESLQVFNNFDFDRREVVNGVETLYYPPGFLNGDTPVEVARFKACAHLETLPSVGVQQIGFSINGVTHSATFKISDTAGGPGFEATRSMTYGQDTGILNSDQRMRLEDGDCVNIDLEMNRPVNSFGGDFLLYALNNVQSDNSLVPVFYDNGESSYGSYNVFRESRSSSLSIPSDAVSLPLSLDGNFWWGGSFSHNSYANSSTQSGPAEVKCVASPAEARAVMKMMMVSNVSQFNGHVSLPETLHDVVFTGEGDNSVTFRSNYFTDLVPRQWRSYDLFAMALEAEVDGLEGVDCYLTDFEASEVPYVNSGVLNEQFVPEKGYHFFSLVVGENAESEWVELHWNYGDSKFSAREAKHFAWEEMMTTCGSEMTDECSYFSVTGTVSRNFIVDNPECKLDEVDLSVNWQGGEALPVLLEVVSDLNGAVIHREVVLDPGVNSIIVNNDNGDFDMNFLYNVDINLRPLDDNFPVVRENPPFEKMTVTVNDIKFSRDQNSLPITYETYVQPGDWSFGVQPLPYTEAEINFAPPLLYADSGTSFTEYTYIGNPNPITLHEAAFRAKNGAVDLCEFVYLHETDKPEPLGTISQSYYLENRSRPISELLLTSWDSSEAKFVYLNDCIEAPADYSNMRKKANAEVIITNPSSTTDVETPLNLKLISVKAYPQGVPHTPEFELPVIVSEDPFNQTRTYLGDVIGGEPSVLNGNVVIISD